MRNGNQTVYRVTEPVPAVGAQPGDLLFIGPGDSGTVVLTRRVPSNLVARTMMGAERFNREPHGTT